MSDFIIDIYYSQEEISDLIETKNIGYGTMAGVCSSALLLGVCNVANASVVKELSKIEENHNTEYVVSQSNDFCFEDYPNIFLDCDYKYLWDNMVLDRDKRQSVESILSFKSLEESWDGYGAYPLEVKSASNAIRFLEILDLNSKFYNPTDIFPNPNGTVSLVWENEEDERISLEIGNDAMSYYTKFNTVETEFFNDVEVNEANIENITRKIKALY
jgi:hypothetical protein